MGRVTASTFLTFFALTWAAAFRSAASRSASAFCSAAFFSAASRAARSSAKRRSRAAFSSSGSRASSSPRALPQRWQRSSACPLTAPQAQNQRSFSTAGIRTVSAPKRSRYCFASSASFRACSGVSGAGKGSQTAPSGALQVLLSAKMTSVTAAVKARAELWGRGIGFFAPNSASRSAFRSR